MKAIAENNIELVTDHLKVTPYSVEVNGKPSAEEWMDFFRKVSQVNSMSQFYLGDLVVCAEFEWGDKYTDLIDLTDYDYDTLTKYASVARRYSPEFREEVAHVGKIMPSWSAFKTVASVDDDRAKYFLRMVVEGGWSIRRLEDEVKRYKNGGKLPAGNEQPIGVSSFKEIGKNLVKPLGR